MSEYAASRQHREPAVEPASDHPPPVEIDISHRDPQEIAIEILRSARSRLSSGPTPCAADSERLLTSTAWRVFEGAEWPNQSAESIRLALERILPPS